MKLKWSLYFFIRLWLFAAVILAFQCEQGGNQDSLTNAVSDPLFSPTAGTYSNDQSVIITTATSGAVIYYSTDGSTPTTASSVYSAPIPVAGNGTTVTIKAIATASGMSDSAVISSVYTINYTQASTPQFSPAAGIFGTSQNVSISSSTSGATICYTSDGITNPACSATGSCSMGAVYLGVPINIATSQTIKAMACKTGFIDSTISSAGYIIDTTPPVSPAGLIATAAGSSQINLSWSTATDNVSTSASLVYEICRSLTSGGCNTFSVSYTSAAGTTGFNVTGLTALTQFYFKIRAKDEAGNVSTASMEISGTTNPAGTVNTPTFSTIAGIYGSAQNVTISSTTTGASICYTNDGVTNPACDATAACSAGIAYVSAVNVSFSQILKAVACKTGWTSSSVNNVSYTIDTIAPSEPTGLTATSAGLTLITLNWSASSDNVTSSPNVMYEICKSTSVGGCTTFTVNYTTTAGITSYTIPGLNAQTFYTFRVRAIDQAGNRSTAINESSTSTMYWASVSAGSSHALAIRSDGTLWAWGDNSSGQLGDGTTTNRTSPAQIGTATNWTNIAAGNTYGRHSLAIRSDGTLWAWGENALGQLGDGTTTNRISPVQIGSATNWANISGGGNHSLAIRSDGTLWTWGYNFYGQLGNGTTTNRTSPAQIGTATNWANISGGGNHSLAIKSDGTLWAWGYNYYGQLGDGFGGNSFPNPSPVQIGTATNWVSIACSDNHSLALDGTGGLWAWGDNSLGQLSDGIVSNPPGLTQYSPIQISGLTGWNGIAGGAGHSLGMNLGVLFGWGYNLFTIGGGSASKTTIFGSTGSANIVAAGRWSSYHIRNGYLYVWGDNSVGQLGDGTTISQTSPVQLQTP